MYVAGTARAVVTSPEVGVACCLTSLDDVTNAVKPEVADLHQSEGAVLLLVAHGFVFALSVTGNAIVLYVIGRHLGYRTATNVYITTLRGRRGDGAGLLAAGRCVRDTVAVASRRRDVVRGV